MDGDAWCPSAIGRLDRGRKEVPFPLEIVEAEADWIVRTLYDDGTHIVRYKQTVGHLMGYLSVSSELEACGIVHGGISWDAREEDGRHIIGFDCSSCLDDLSARSLLPTGKWSGGLSPLLNPLRTVDDKRFACFWEDEHKWGLTFRDREFIADNLYILEKSLCPGADTGTLEAEYDDACERSRQRWQSYLEEVKRLYH